MRLFLPLNLSTVLFSRYKHFIVMGGIVIFLCGFILPLQNQSNLDPHSSANPSAAIGDGADPLASLLKVKSTCELVALFEAHDYCLKSFMNAGALRAIQICIPQLFLEAIPDDFARHEHPISERKMIFMQTLLPFILEANAEILQERQELICLANRLEKKESLSICEYAWLDDLARKYNFRKFTYERASELLKKVDIIPVSMALAQAAEETGWGTSYAARVKRSVFGVTLSTGVKAYKTLRHSVKAYMRNLNANPAYAKMREIRLNLRNQGGALCSIQLMDGLYHYSELHHLYIKKVKAHILKNQLARFDGATLKEAGLSTLS